MREIRTERSCLSRSKAFPIVKEARNRARVQLSSRMRALGSILSTANNNKIPSGVHNFFFFFLIYRALRETDENCPQKSVPPLTPDFVFSFRGSLEP
jgi:hypothetical protein